MLPLLPTNGKHDTTLFKRVLESINGILRFDFDDSRNRTAAEVFAGVYPENPSYPPTDPRRWGLPLDFASDCTPTLNKIIAIANSSPQMLYIDWPAGVFYFNSKPDDVNGTLFIRGQGKNNTYLIRNYTESTASNGLFTYKQGGGRAPSGSGLQDLLVATGSGCTGGALISLIAPSSGDGPDWCRFESLRLTNSQGVGGTGNGPDYLFYIDGSARTSPPGVRNTWINNSIIFAGATGAAYFKGCNGLHSIGTSYAAGGSVSGKVVLTGDATVKSNDCAFVGGVLYGMDLDYCNLLLVDSQEINGDITNTANVSNVVVRGKQSSGTVQTNWTGSVYQSPEGFPYQGQVFAGDTIIGDTANIGSAPRAYIKGGSSGPVVYGEQTAANGYVFNSKAVSNGGTYYHMNLDDAGTAHGSISSNGTNASFNTTSDARLKYDIRPAIGSGAVIDNIRIRSFKWKINDSAQRYGVIAQEIEQVFPECVTVGIDDESTLSVDYSKMVPLLVLEIQELRKRVAGLEK